MTTALSDRHIPRELEPAVERLFNDHLHNPKTWNPYDYAQWDDRCEFTGVGRIVREPGRSEFSDGAQTAMITNPCIEDSLPSYHRQISEPVTLDGVWAARGGRCGAPQRFDEQRRRAAARQAEWAAAAR
ncbi:acyl-ACP desaturase [Nocardia sp. Marseille-Q1738]